jgi:hypothetical protein
MTVEKKPLELNRVLSALDNKDRDFIDSLTPPEEKQLSPFMMIRWGSSTTASYDMQAYYLLSVNERLNKNFFDISAKDHKKFQWLLATTVSPGMGKQYYKWLGKKKVDPAKAKVLNFLQKIYPTAKTDEIELMATLNDKKDLKELARKHGWDEKQIKEYL